MNSFLSWLRQGTTQTGFTLLMGTGLGYASGTLPLGGAILGAITGIAGLVYPESGSVQAEISAVTTSTLQALANIPAVGSVLGMRAPAGAAAASTTQPPAAQA